jgi:hypothetical protein
MISGIKGLLGAHPIGSLAGLGNKTKQEVVNKEVIPPAHTIDPINDYLGAATAPEDDYDF